MSRMRQGINLSRGSDYMQMVVVVVKTMQRRKTGGVVLAGALKMSRVIRRIIAFLGKEAGLIAANKKNRNELALLISDIQFANIVRPQEHH